jgi:hypothetical protein
MVRRARPRRTTSRPNAGPIACWPAIKSVTAQYAIPVIAITIRQQHGLHIGARQPRLRRAHFYAQIAVALLSLIFYLVHPKPDRR